MDHASDRDKITVGAFGVRFLIEAADSNGSAAVFECSVPANARMPAPHSHDGFEEMIYGLWRSQPRPCSGPPTSARSARSSPPAPTARRISPRSAQ
jgi:hypothetical protein